MPLKKNLIGEFKNIFGAASVIADETLLPAYAYDATGICVLPGCVIFPDCPENITRLLALLNEEQIPVIPRGAGTGFSGGSVPREGGVVLSFTRMNRILDLNKRDLFCVCSPGTVNGDVKERAGEQGLFYPPDPSSSDISTIGGNIAENAGGPLAFKYGVTADYLLGLKCITGDGRLIDTGSKTPKCVTGYNLKDLIAGSEGTLAIIYEATLRLIPKPESRLLLSRYFRDFTEMTAFIDSLLDEGIIPSLMEFMDRRSLLSVKEFSGIAVPDGATCLLLLELDGNLAKTAYELDKIKIMSPDPYFPLTAASNEKEAALLWKTRKALSPSVARISPTKINEDVVLPRSRIAAFLDHLACLSTSASLPIAAFGHIGDGNIHINIMTDKKNPVEYKKALDLVDGIMDRVIADGGTISGEHGIGLTKKDFLSKELSPAALNLMKQIKGVFDPNGILNPGKIFP